MEQHYKRSIQIVILVLVPFMMLGLTVTSNAQEEKIKFAVISDTKTNKGYTGLENALTFISEQHVDFIIVAGDFSPVDHIYANYFSEWGFGVNENQPSDMQGVYFVLGNHDREPFGEIFFQVNIAPYYPANGPHYAPEGTVFSFDRGNAHFVITNQYWNNTQGGYTPEQLYWIENDLKTSEKPYKFVIGHEPAFPMDRHVGDSLDSDPEMRDDFWTVLADNNVKAFFCGHTHHVSVINKQSVYQIDTGRVVPDHLAVAVVEIDGSSAALRLYETKGSIPTVGQNGDVYNSSLQNNADGDEVYTVLFDSEIESPDDPWGCFIHLLN
jgi:3',5'-cyclic AMP phosphodiesterase CpdA